MLTDNSFTHPKIGKIHKVKGRIACVSTFIVYLLTCPCGLLYVGKRSDNINPVFLSINVLLERMMKNHQLQDTSILG